MCKHGPQAVLFFVREILDSTAVTWCSDNRKSYFNKRVQGKKKPGMVAGLWFGCGAVKTQTMSL